MEHAADFILVRAVLMRDWGPIICNQLLPDPEYNSYIPRIIELLNTSCSVEQLSGYLLHIERDYMEVDTNPECAALVASNLITARKQRRAPLIIWSSARRKEALPWPPDASPA